MSITRVDNYYLSSYNIIIITQKSSRIVLTHMYMYASRKGLHGYARFTCRQLGMYSTIVYTVKWNVRT